MLIMSSYSVTGGMSEDDDFEDEFDEEDDDSEDDDEGDG